MLPRNRRTQTQADGPSPFFGASKIWRGAFWVRWKFEGNDGFKKLTTKKRLKFEVTKKPTPFLGCFFGGSGVGFLKKIKQIMGGVFFGIFVSDEWKDQSKRSFVYCSKRKFRKTANWWKDLLPFFLQEMFGFKGKKMSYVFMGKDKLNLIFFQEKHCCKFTII